MSNNGNGRKKGNRPPQFARIGEGFPVPIKEVFDLLSPNPIDGIRIPLMDLFKKIQEIPSGSSRSGPYTSLQLQNDLKAPYATLASNMLIMGLRIAFAQMEFAKQQSFVFQRHKLLKALREYFDLKELEILDFKLSSGRLAEPAKPGIPYAPEKYAPEQLMQMTKDHAKLTNEIHEKLVSHQKIWENFDITAAPIVSERMLRESPASKSLDTIVKNIQNHPRVKENPELLEVAKNIDAAKEKVLKKNAEEIQSIKPLSEKEIKMVEESFEASGDELPKDHTSKKSNMAELKSFFVTMKTEAKVEAIEDAAKAIQTDMNHEAISTSAIIQKSEDLSKIQDDQIPDFSNKMATFASKAKNSAAIKKVLGSELQATHKSEIDLLKEQESKLMAEIANAKDFAGPKAEVNK